MCLDQNTFINLKKYLIRVANLNQNLMQTRVDAISDINSPFSWIMVSFLCINRYHFLARWHKHNTYQHLFCPMSSQRVLCLGYVCTKPKVNVYGNDTIAMFNWFFGGFLFIFFLCIYFYDYRRRCIWIRMCSDEI